MSKTISAVALLCLLTSCKKEKIDRLPEATQEGKNTAGFLTDGKVFKPQSGNGFIPGTPVYGSREKNKGGTILTLSFADYRSGRQSSVGIRLVDVHQPGTYTLDQQETIILGGVSPSYLVYHNDLIDQRAQFYSGPSAPVIVTITRLDTIKNIVSGTFEGSPLEDGGSRTVSITQGRFDVKFERR
ncbi:hypothetical protein DNI29_13470 [Hymenobacter sediminis]|uniref:hypothetical protein n=1 Tax=Hymenobacter sediminis TaxID=2218621 RepID=UPI000DA6A7AA|nr:hypothetical protein [Hymenobacter sediminis]RPD47152.1 hypothetical protein DNI29_13470 [Hymenobacter sediminis]